MIYKLMITTKDPAELRDLLSKIEYQTTGPKIIGKLEVEPVLQATDAFADQLTVASNTVTPQAPTVPVGVTVDVTGVPWNPELHSSSKAFNADGSWKKKKNFKKTEAEMPVVAPTPTTLVQPPAPTVQVSVPQFIQPSTPVVPQTVVPTATQTTTEYQNIPTVPQTTDRPALDFQSFKNDLPMIVARLISSGQIKQEYVDQLNKYFGVQHIYNVWASERQCMELFNVLAQQGFITKVDDYVPNVSHTATADQLVNAMNGVQ